MKQVDELIRGERSAVESIDAVLKRLNNSDEQQKLESIRADHMNAISTLNRYGGGSLDKTSQSSGPWGAFASAFTGGASFFGDKAALQALKVGEQHGINEYKEALEDDGINMELKEVIRSELLPQQEQHLRMIERYLQ